MNKNEILEAVKRYGRALYYASEELKNDREVVLEAVKYNEFALKYASEELRTNKEILYMFKDFLIKNEKYLSIEYELFKSYEREDKLKEECELSSKDRSTRLKSKI